jgi:hypothetical protein
MLPQSAPMPERITAPDRLPWPAAMLCILGLSGLLWVAVFEAIRLAF